METIVITGGTGFIGLHCVQKALEAGYKVKATVRSDEKKQELLKAMKKHSSKCENLEIVSADLLHDDKWDGHMKGASYVIHLASPFFMQEPKDELEMITPAVDGTLRVLKSAVKNDVKKVVLTSSLVSIISGHKIVPPLFNESYWSNIDANIGAYAKSKTLAEKTAWKFIDSQSKNDKTQLTCINPPAVLGPMLNNHTGVVNDMICKMANGEFPMSPKIHMGFVDVRDVARAHIDSLTDPSTNGQRIILSSGEMFMVDLGKMLYKDGFKKAPVREMPNFIVRALSYVKPEIGALLPMLGKEHHTDQSTRSTLFNWDLIPIKDSVKVTADQLVKMGKIHSNSSKRAA